MREPWQSVRAPLPSQRPRCPTLPRCRQGSGEDQFGHRNPVQALTEAPVDHDELGAALVHPSMQRLARSSTSSLRLCRAQWPNVRADARVVPARLQHCVRSLRVAHPPRLQPAKHVRPTAAGKCRYRIARRRSTARTPSRVSGSPECETTQCRTLPRRLPQPTPPANAVERKRNSKLRSRIPPAATSWTSRRRYLRSSMESSARLPE